MNEEQTITLVLSADEANWLYKACRDSEQRTSGKIIRVGNSVSYDDNTKREKIRKYRKERNEYARLKGVIEKAMAEEGRKCFI